MVDGAREATSATQKATVPSATIITRHIHSIQEKEEAKKKGCIVYF